MELLLFLAGFGLVLVGATAVRMWHRRRQRRAQRHSDIRLFWLLYQEYHRHQP